MPRTATISDTKIEDISFVLKDEKGNPTQQKPDTADVWIEEMNGDFGTIENPAVNTFRFLPGSAGATGKIMAKVVVGDQTFTDEVDVTLEAGESKTLEMQLTPEADTPAADPGAGNTAEPVADGGDTPAPATETQTVDPSANVETQTVDPGADGGTTTTDAGG